MHIESRRALGFALALGIATPVLVTPVKRRRINKVKPVDTTDPVKPRMNMSRWRREMRGIDTYV